MLSAMIKGLIGQYSNEIIGHFTGKWLKMLRELSHQKLKCGKSPSCNFQGMSKMLKMHASCMQKEPTVVLVIVVKDVKDVYELQYRF